MKNRKEFQELNRMAYPILLHYLLTSLFEILDQAIVGHYSVRGFAVVGIAASVVYGVTGALGMLSSAFHIIAAEKIGKQDERGFENAFAGVNSCYFDRSDSCTCKYPVWKAIFLCGI